MRPVISLRNLHKYFGSQHVLRGISAELHAGTFYVLLGKNGAGKSTLMRVLMRYERPDSGQGEILGVPLEADAASLNQDIGYVSESLDYVLPVRMHKLFGYFSELYPRWDSKLFESILGELRVDLTRHFKELSRGQKMQVAFAAALAIRPKILLLDEITAVLDANARCFFMDYLGRFTRDGGTVVMATNIVSEVQNFANHMVLLHEGAVALDIPVRELERRFLKLRRRAGEYPDGGHANVFEDPECIEVCLNADGSTSHVLTRDAAARHALGEAELAALADNRGITAEEIFIFFTRSRWR